jgi:hypothetical protein
MSRKRAKPPLEQLAGDLGEAGPERDRHERHGAPDDQGRDHAEPFDRVREPVVLDVVAEAELREDVVDDAVLVVGHPEPELRGDHHWDRPGED